MFDHIPIRKRLRVLLGLLGLTFVFGLVYFVQALQVRAQVTELRVRLAGQESGETRMLDYKVRLASLENEIRGMQKSGLRLCTHSEFIAWIESQCQALGLRLFSLPVEERETVQNYEVAHITLRVEGDFHAITKLIYQIEHTDRIASVEKVQMETQTVRIQRSRREILVCALSLNRLLQTPEDCNNEFSTQ